MLNSLRLVLDKDLDYKQSSLLQGVLFEHVDSDYVNQMHQQNMHPYSQYISRVGDKSVWVINTLTDESKEKIIDPLSKEDFSSFKLKQKNGEEVHIIERSLTGIDRKTLLNDFYENKPTRKIRINFLTPTAFKHNGIYVILPDLRLLYQSLMMKYSASSEQLNMIDEDTLNEMVSDSFVSGYRLSSRVFPMEHTTVPGFVGNVTISFRGKSTVLQYIRLLFRFAEYSGVGIKTGMGMGAVQIVKENDDE